jgi:hypothetical protein
MAAYLVRMSEVEAEVARRAEQRMRSAVNFGVACLRRALGADPDEVLDLRCECGRAECCAPIRISVRDYQRAPLVKAFLISRQHADLEHGRTRASTPAWMIVDGTPSKRQAG